MNTLLRLGTLGCAALLAACSVLTTPPVDMHAASAAPLVAAPVPAPTHGAIFQAATHRPLFEDRRARLAGDTLTIQIEETLTASQQSTTKLDRSGNVSSSISAAPFGTAKYLGKLGVGAESSASGNGDGKTNSTNTFTGVITVTVLQVLPSGNLLVGGEKQIGVNQNVDVLRFSGVVNPVTIRAGNVVSSTQVADARLEQRGRGDVGRVQGLGWLSRFFLSVAPV
ncbi:MAG TPA: flagellar basal body L-ring protein FlgH [Ramlibacter sp.]|uniref:flagellar basal body L-ring protein FlgH n=1 Tax=Ramlibacter sp. TaxID=1917967 RepID=UPI002D6AD055|nr:flagellar basal body L-ring protein FlgH [Ramlibacter sp.]HZY18567.1 flagellar basal body L-ring protein FlgH [Ramlibacter sp.]